MFKRLLVPLDQSRLAEQALGMAASIARASGAALDVATVCESNAGGAAPASDAAMDRAHRYLDTIVKEIATGTGIRATHAVLRGDAAEKICARAFEADADLIVMTTHGRTGLSRAWLGSVAEGVMRRSSLPVLMVRPRARGAARSAAWPPMRQVVVPLDGSNLASEILPSATKLARANKASLVLLEVVQPVPMMALDLATPDVAPLPVTDDDATQTLVDEAERHLAGLVRRLRDEGFANAESHVVVGVNVAQKIADFARSHHADLLAMSTHGRGLSRLVVGSVADKVRRASSIPIMLRRPAVVSEELGFLTARSVEHQLPALSGV